MQQTRIALLLSTLFGTSVLNAEPVSNNFTTSDGVNIHYLTDGDDGSYVVLVHGFTSSARGDWYNTQIAQQLAEHYRVIAIDMRNHGESQVVQERQPGIVRDVLELLDHLEIDKVHMHGYSMGGATTLAILAYAPERLITASAGGMGVADLPGNIAPGAEFDWNAALTDRVPVQFPIDLTQVEIPVMTINGSDDAPYPKTVRMTRELKNYTNFILPGYGHMNAMQPGTGYAERLMFFLSQND
ncbi:MAG: alpha/beta hydrolase [Pseudohongiella sp.]|nr:alpha/beta hydrolase [Pseudohongiella sp.]